MKNPIKTALFLLLFIASANQIHAQGQTIQDVNGKPIMIKSYADIEGTPFLYDNWLSGSAKLDNGQVFNNLWLKYNAVEGILTFKGKGDEPLEFVDHVVEFTLKDVIVNKRFIADATPTAAHPYYEVIADGTTKFLKQIIKELQETKVYGSSTATRTFITADKYYIFKDGKMLPVKKDKKSILTTLGNHQPELEAYIKKDNLNLKNDTDLVSLFIYYNSL